VKVSDGEPSPHFIQAIYLVTEAAGFKPSILGALVDGSTNWTATASRNPTSLPRRSIYDRKKFYST